MTLRKAFSCDLCGQLFSTRDQLKSHYEDIHKPGEAPYVLV